MERLSTGHYRCRVCHEIIETNNRVGSTGWHVAASGGGRQYRVVTIGGLPVHQCPFPGPTARWWGEIRQ